MKLTPVQLYTVNHHGTDALPEDVAIWAASPGEAATRFLEDDITAFDRMVHVMRTGLDFSFRIDPDPVTPPTAPVQWWVKGPPPKDGEWYLVTYTDTVDGSPQPGTAQWDDDAFYDDGGAAYGSATITYHQPTPIQPPKES